MIKVHYPPIEFPGRTYKNYKIYLCCFTEDIWGSKWDFVIGNEMSLGMVKIYPIPKDKKPEILISLTPDDWITAIQISEKLNKAMELIAKSLERNAE